MKINVLAFGIAKEILGNNSVALDLENNSVDGLKATLERMYPQLKDLTSFAIAVNNEYAGPGYIIKPGDEIAIIPPVSGG